MWRHGPLCSRCCRCIWLHFVQQCQQLLAVLVECSRRHEAKQVEQHGRPLAQVDLIVLAVRANGAETGRAVEGQWTNEQAILAFTKAAEEGDQRSAAEASFSRFGAALPAVAIPCGVSDRPDSCPIYRRSLSPLSHTTQQCTRHGPNRSRVSGQNRHEPKFPIQQSS